MTSTSVEPGESGVEVGVAPLRVVTAASLFDGHDAAINVMRRLIQSRGAEVIHLGHNRGVAEVVRAAIQEDADAVAISSYQGGHVEYFRYMVEMLRERGAGGIRVFGGGGGTITPTEIAELAGARGRADLPPERRSRARARGHDRRSRRAGLETAPGCLPFAAGDPRHGSTTMISRSPRRCPRSRTACSWATRSTSA